MPGGSTIAGMPVGQPGNPDLRPDAAVSVAPTRPTVAMPTGNAKVLESRASAGVVPGIPGPVAAADPAVAGRAVAGPAPRRNRTVGLIQWAESAPGVARPAKPALPTRTVRFHDKPVEGSRIADAPVRPELPRRRVIFFDPVDPTKAPDRIREATKDAAARKTAGTPPAPATGKQDDKPKDGKPSGDGA